MRPKQKSKTISQKNQPTTGSRERPIKQAKEAREVTSGKSLSRIKKSSVVTPSAPSEGYGQHDSSGVTKTKRRTGAIGKQRTITMGGEAAGLDPRGPVSLDVQGYVLSDAKSLPVDDDATLYLQKEEENPSLGSIDNDGNRVLFAQFEDSQIPGDRKFKKSTGLKKKKAPVGVQVLNTQSSHHKSSSSIKRTIGVKKSRSRSRSKSREFMGRDSSIEPIQSDRRHKRSTSDNKRSGSRHKRSGNKSLSFQKQIERQERARQLELRKQIIEKEKQLQRMTEQAKKLRSKLGSSRAESNQGEGDYGESGRNSYQKQQSSYQDVSNYRRWEGPAGEIQTSGGVVNIQTNQANQHTFRDPDQMVALRRSSRTEKQLRTSKRSSKAKQANSSIEGRKESKNSRGRTDDSQSITYKEGGGIQPFRQSKSPSSGGGLRSQHRGSRQTANLQHVSSIQESNVSPLRKRSDSSGRRPILMNGYQGLRNNQDLNTIQERSSFRPSPQVNPLASIPLRTQQSRETRNSPQEDWLPSRGPSLANSYHKHASHQPLRQVSPLQSQELSQRYQPQPKIFQPERSHEMALDVRRRERINMLKIDNDSTKRRLELVNGELEQVRHEKEGLRRRITDCQMEITRLEANLGTDSVHSAEAQKASFEDQINLQKKQNERTRGDISDMHKEISTAEDKNKATLKERNDLQLNLQSMGYEVNMKDKDIGKLEQKQKAILVKLEDYEQEISELTEMQNGLSMDKDELDYHILKLQKERDQLYQKVIKKQTDNEVGTRDLNMKQVNLSTENTINAKFITTKIIASLLQSFQAVRERDAYREIKQYAQFDKDCTVRLKALSLVYHKVSQLRMRQGLHQWYRNSLVPFEQRNQNEALAALIPLKRLKLRVFNALRNNLQAKQIVYLSKSDGVNIIWERLLLNAKAELKRGIDIWKSSVFHKRDQRDRLAKIVAHHRCVELRRALLKWRFNGHEVEYRCRAVILQRDFARKVFMTSLLQAWRRETVVSVKHRLLTQGKVWKAWNDYIEYKKLLASQQMTSMRFAITFEQYKLRVCFNALKLNKQQQATQLMNYALENDMNVSLAKNEDEIDNVTGHMHYKMRERAIKAINNQLSAGLASYFRRWQQALHFKGVTIRTKWRDRVIAVYRGKLEHAFQRFKMCVNDKKKRKRKVMIEDIQMDNKLQEKDFFDTKKINRTDAIAVSSVATHKTSKIVKRLLMRQVKGGLYQWKRRVDQMTFIGAMQNSIFCKQKKRLLQQAWQRFKDFLLKQQQHDRNLNSCDHLMETFRDRALRRHFNALCAFVLQHRRARNYWGCILSRMDLWMKQRIMNKWRDNGGEKVLFELNQIQNNTVEVLEAKSRMVDDKDQNNDWSNKSKETLENSLKVRARAQFGNYVQRYSSGMLVKTLKKWRNRASTLTQERALIKKYLNHWRRHRFDFVQWGFKNWVHASKMSERRKLKKQIIIQQEEQILSIDHNEEIIGQKREVAKRDMLQAVKVQKFKKKRIDKSIDIMTRRNLDLWFVSRKRLIFSSWRHAVIQEKAFVLCVKNVLEKSMYMKGFMDILKCNRDVKKETKVAWICNKFMQHFKMNNLSSTFAQWKAQILKKVSQNTEAIIMEKMDVEEEIRVKRSAIKKQNCGNVEWFLKKRKLQKIWDSWLLQNWQHMQKGIMKDRGGETMEGVRWQRSLQKWNLRTALTIKIRRNFTYMDRNKRFRMKVKIWKALVDRRNHAYDLSKSLCNLEGLLREKMFGDAFKSIRSYQVSKNHAEHKRRKRALGDLHSILNSFHLKRTKKYFERYRCIVRTKKLNAKHVASVIAKLGVADMRDGFKRWVDFMKHTCFAEDMNQTGPITEYVFEFDRTIHNLCEFMREEHYTPEEINQLVEGVHQYNQHLLDMIVKRLKLPVKNRIVARALNQWKFYIGVRKLVKWTLSTCGNKVQFGKCDMQWAFQKWRRSDETCAGELRRRTWKRLCDLNIKQSRILAKCASAEARNNTDLAQLNLTRDELLENYDKARKLALARCSTSHTHARQKAFNRWKKHRAECIKTDLSGLIMDGVHRIANMKQLQKELEADNAKVADENDELRRFSMDGYVIAKSVKQLSDEREKLTVDLADKAFQINELLERNRMVKEQLAALGYTSQEYVGTKNGVTIKREKSTEIRGRNPESY